VVEPSKSEAEPSVTAHFLTTKLKDEVAIMTLFERKSNVHKKDVLELPFISVADGSPNGSCGRIEQWMALALRSKIPQIGIVVGIDADTTSDNLAAPDCCKQTTVISLAQFPKLF
jgi:hypothetical protein